MTARRLLVIDGLEGLRHVPRERMVDVLRSRDLVVANDAATMPASLHGVHMPTGKPVEVRLAAWRSLSTDPTDFTAVVFGAGDFHTRTEDRSNPPAIAAGDRLALGPLSATVTHLLGHARLIGLHFSGSSDEIWAGIAHHGRPVQYAHVQSPLALWDVWTAVAGPPVAFEPPSAGFALDWEIIAALHARDIGFVTITHAAGISSTGDAALDMQLPLDEPYDVPISTARAIARTRASGGRIIAIGTTVVRALEHAAGHDGIVRAGRDIATGRIGPGTQLRVVDAILTGVHERGTSHYEMLRAFADDVMLAAADEELVAQEYRRHEFGDSVLVIPAVV